MRRAGHPWDRFYRHHKAPWRGERAVEPLRPWLGEGPVLELGCGNGKSLRPLQRAGIDAVGIDVSWHALRRLGQGLMADAAALPLGDETFTAVLDIHCTGHLDPVGRKAALEEARRVLRPGGHLVVERLGRGDLRAGQGEPAPGDDEARRLQDGRTTHFTDQAGLAVDVDAAGFEVVAQETVKRSPRFGSSTVMRENVIVVGRRTG